MLANTNANIGNEILDDSPTDNEFHVNKHHLGAIQYIPICPPLLISRNFSCQYYFEIVNIQNKTFFNNSYFYQVVQFQMEQTTTCVFQIMHINELEGQTNLTLQLPGFILNDHCDIIDYSNIDNKEGEFVYFKDPENLYQYLKIKDDLNQYKLDKMEEIKIGRGNLVGCNHKEVIILDIGSEKFYKLNVSEKKSEHEEDQNYECFEQPSQFQFIGKLNLDLNYTFRNVLYHFRFLKVSNEYLILNILLLDEAEFELYSQTYLYRRHEQSLERSDKFLSQQITIERALQLSQFIVDEQFQHLYTYDNVYQIPSFNKIMHIENVQYFQFNKGEAHYIVGGFFYCQDMQNQEQILKYQIIQNNLIQHQLLHIQFDKLKGFTKLNNQIFQHDLWTLFDLHQVYVFEPNQKKFNLLKYQEEEFTVSDGDQNFSSTSSSLIILTESSVTSDSSSTYEYFLPFAFH